MNWYKKATWNVDDSSEALEQEQWDAQGEEQNFLGPDDKTSDLFRENIEMMSITDIVSESRLASIKRLIDNQGGYGRETVESLKEAISNGSPVPPVTITKTWSGKWQLTSGRHRILAALELGLTEVPVQIMEWTTK